MVTLKALTNIEAQLMGTTIELSDGEFMAEMEKGLHKHHKRPISMLLNHCEVVEAKGDTKKAYADFAKAVKPRKDKTPEQTFDPFRRD